MQDKKYIFTLGGLGNQYKNMGKALFQKSQSFQKHLESFEAVISQELHYSIIDYLDKPNLGQKEMLKDCLGLFAIEYASVNYLIELGLKPDYYLGQSLGELVAAVMTKAITLKDMIYLLVALANALNKQQNASGMLSVFGSWDLIKSEIEERELGEYAGKNHHANFLIAYEDKMYSAIRQFFKEKNMLTLPLDIPYGFHASYIDYVRDDMFLSGTDSSFYPGRAKCFSAIDGREIKELGMESIWNAIRMPYDIPGTLETIKAAIGDFVVVDLTPNGAIYSYIQYIDRELAAATLLKGMNHTYDGTRQIQYLYKGKGGYKNDGRKSKDY